jgi:hypothetical protein
LKTALLLGIIHTFWHLVPDFWGAGVFYGNLYLIHFLLWAVGLTTLRIMIIWIYVRTNSLVLGWLTHFSYTGGQLLLVPLSLTAVETILWNTAFIVVLLLVLVLSFAFNKDFRDYCRMGIQEGMVV